MASMAMHVEAMLAMQRAGAVVFDYGNNLRQRAYDYGVKNAFDYPGFVPAFIRPLFCEGSGPFRWVALCGDPEDISRHRPHHPGPVPRERAPAALDHHGPGAGRVPGPAGAHLLAGLRRAGPGRPGLQRGGGRRPRQAPIVIGRDHLDSGSVASPNRETEGMRDGSDAISDWPMLNALINAVGGATWVSFHHGGGVGIGYSQHAGQVIVADGTPEAAAPPGARADHRPRHGRRAPRRRRLPGGDCVCEAGGREGTDDGGVGW